VASNAGSGVAAIVEVRAETDFTAKNEKFVDAVNKIAEIALEANAGAVEANDAIGAIIDDLRITTGENISFARGQKITGETGTTAYGVYVHHDGKTGVLLQAEGSVGDDTLRQVCMHIAAAPTPPLGVGPDDIPADVVEKEKAFRISQAEESGKPREIAEKIVEGGMRKFFEEVALVEQPFVMDESKKIKDVIGKDAKVIQFFRWQVGG
jgi:elongation factor Ts